jgi:hypothetical protein
MNGLSYGSSDDAHAVELAEVPAGDYIVSLLSNDLPDDVAKIMEVLRTERSALASWLDVARAYLATGRPAQYTEVLRCCCLTDK